MLRGLGFAGIAPRYDFLGLLIPRSMQLQISLSISYSTHSARLTSTYFLPFCDGQSLIWPAKFTLPRRRQVRLGGW